MKSSSPDPRAVDGTSALWARRRHDVAALPFTAALIGRDTAELADAAALSLAASPEAAKLVGGMELRVRTLTSTAASEPVRCAGTVRGPVLWSETITARANSFGADDVFVCQATTRSFDTVENRLLVDALDAVTKADRALRGPVGARVTHHDAERIATIAAEAQRWRRHPRLSGIRRGRLQGRELGKLRSGRRTARMASEIAVLERATEPFRAEDIVGLAGADSTRYHTFVEEVIAELERRDLLGGKLTFADGALWSGPLSFRHPTGPGSAPLGLCYRGVPLIPPLAVVETAPWRSALPRDGVHLNSIADLNRLLERFSSRTARLTPRPSMGGPQRRSSSSSSSTTMS